MKILFIVFTMMFGCTEETSKDTNTDTNTEDTNTENTDTEDTTWGCLSEEWSKCFDMSSTDGWTFEEALEACTNNDGEFLNNDYGCDIENVVYECTIEIPYEATLYYLDDYWDEEDATEDCDTWQ